MEGYFDNTPIHRIVSKFIVQCGDPTGTGMGGESIYGKPFKDEIHSRLKFTTRGLLAMANTGPNTNQSQFFFTLTAAPGLNGKNTIFGRVVGDTLFNLLRIGELETDKDDRPIYDARIITSEILSNPFDDIVPRTTREERKRNEEEEERRRQELEKKKKSKGTKNLALLSFGEEASADALVPKLKIQSSHDIAKDPRLLKEAVDVSGAIPKQKKRKYEVENDEGEEEYDKKMKQNIISTKANGTENEKTYLFLI
jgi:peptidyl-prolyl cis-trans isomerase SDCCAG10